jgi:hypothetical protein
MPPFFIKFVKEKIDMQYSTFITHHLQLNTLANSCPYLAGNALLKARAFYANFVPSIFYDDVAVCNALGVYKTTHDSTDYEKEEALMNADLQNVQEAIGFENIKVYPNPATDQITIEYELQKNSIGKVIILDATGKIIMELQLAGGKRRVIADIADISAGIYSIKISTSTRTLYNQKLNVVH